MYVNNKKEIIVLLTSSYEVEKSLFLFHSLTHENLIFVSFRFDRKRKQ